MPSGLKGAAFMPELRIKMFRMALSTGRANSRSLLQTECMWKLRSPIMAHGNLEKRVVFRGCRSSVARSWKNRARSCGSWFGGGAYTANSKTKQGNTNPRAGWKHMRPDCTLIPNIFHLQHRRSKISEHMKRGRKTKKQRTNQRNQKENRIQGKPK